MSAQFDRIILSEFGLQFFEKFFCLFALFECNHGLFRRSGGALRWWYRICRSCRIERAGDLERLQLCALAAAGIGHETEYQFHQSSSGGADFSAASALFKPDGRISRIRLARTRSLRGMHRFPSLAAELGCSSARRCYSVVGFPQAVLLTSSVP